MDKEKIKNGFRDFLSRFNTGDNLSDVQRAKNDYTKIENAKPQAFSYDDKNLNDYYDKMMNRKDFSFDLNGNALWNQYKDKYVTLGQNAMADTIGQSAALTGGYGNSWAQAAGQQAYQQNLNNLNDVVPELYGLALQQYQTEGDEMLKRYQAATNERDFAYGKYRDEYSDWNNDRSFAYGKYTDARDFDYQQKRDDVADRQWQSEFDEGKRQYDQSFNYQKERDTVKDSQWQSEQDESRRRYDKDFDYQASRDTVKDSQWKSEFDEARRQYEKNFDYQKGRDSVSDSQWKQTFDYNKTRDSVADSQWKQTFDYSKTRDKVSDNQWKKTFNYNKSRDKVSDKQWKKTFNYNKSRDKVKDSQWKSEQTENKRQFNETLSFNKSKAGLSGGSGGSGRSGKKTGGGTGYTGGGAKKDNQKKTVPTITRKKAGKTAMQLVTSANYHPSNWDSLLDTTLKYASEDKITDSEVKLVAQELINAHQGDPKKTKKQKEYVVKQIKSKLKGYGV